MVLPVLIVASAWLALMALFVAALVRASAHADRALEDPSSVSSSTRWTDSPAKTRRRTPAVSYAGFAGLAWAQATISREPSTKLPSSRTSVGTMRFPVSRSTS
jgi:hypothetical protein